MKNVKFLSILFAAVFVFFLFPFGAFAAPVKDPYLESDVMEDLRNVFISDEDYYGETKFDPDDPAYGINRSGHLQVLYLAEFGYGTDSYAVYLYVFNPAGEVDAFLTGNGSCNINLVELPLKGNLVSASDDARFLKFKLPVAALMGTFSSGNRLYNVGNTWIELQETGTAAQMKFPIYTKQNITRVFSFAGEGYVTVYSEEQIDINLNPTVYRTATSDKGSGYAYDIFSVYYAIPDEYWAKDENGNLTKIVSSELKSIECEWWEWNADIWITRNEEVYTELKKMQGVRFDNTYKKDYASLYYHFDAQMWSSELSVNSSLLLSGKRIYEIKNVLFRDYLVKENKPTVVVSDTSLVKWDPVIDDERNSNYYRLTQMVEETFNIHSFTGENGADGSFWKRVFNGLLGVDETNMENVKVYVTLTEEDFATYVEGGDNSALAKSLLVNEADLPGLKSFFDKNKDKTVCLFRHAVRDYYADYWICEKGERICSDRSEDLFLSNSYYFEDFDILSMNFEHEGVMYNFHVNAEPKDSWGGASLPTKGQNLFKFITEQLTFEDYFRIVLSLFVILLVVIVFFRPEILIMLFKSSLKTGKRIIRSFRKRE